MTILIAFAAATVLVRCVAWPVLRTWWRAIPLDTDLWPAGADETPEQADVRRQLEAIWEAS